MMLPERQKSDQGRIHLRGHSGKVFEGFGEVTPIFARVLDSRRLALIDERDSLRRMALRYLLISLQSADEETT